MNNSIAALLVASAALTGCESYVEPEPVPGDVFQPAEQYSPTQAGCYSTTIPPKGDLAKDVVGTWQDWVGGSYKVTRFEADGTVTVAAFPLDTHGHPNHAMEANVELRGAWQVEGSTVTIVWSDGVIEKNSTSIESVANCVMLVMLVPGGHTSRIPNPTELEQVTCVPPAAPVSAVVTR